MITTYSHLKNIPISIIFPNLNNIGKQLLRISIVNYDAEAMLFYPGKKLLFEHENLESPITGEFAISVNGNHYILLDEPLTFTIISNTSIVYYTTFTVENDNDAITEGDLLSKYNSQKENFIFDDIELVGTYGLLSPNDFSKLKKLSKYEQYDLGFTFEIPNSYQFIGAVKVDYVSSIFRHKFGICGEIANVEWELIIHESNESNLSLNIINLGYYVKTDFTLKLSFVTHNNGDKYIAIELMIDSNDVSGLNPLHNILHQSINRNNILISQSFIASIDFEFSTLSVEPANYGDEITNFKFDNYLLGYNNVEPILKLTKNINIPNNADLNLLINIGDYYGIESQIENFENVPNGITKSFKIEVKPLYISQSQFAITQTLYSFDSENKQLTFSRLITNSTVGVWENINNHKVLAANITTNENARLVTDAQITKWDGIDTSTWKNPVAIVNDLLSTYPDAQIGWTVYVIAQNCNYIFNGTIWEIASNDGIKLYVELYKHELDELITNNNLNIGTTYGIKNAHPTLYDDGTFDLTKFESINGTIIPGTGYNTGTYTNIPVICEANIEAKGLTLDVTINSGAIESLIVNNIGYKYNIGDILTIDNVNIGGVGSGFSYTVVSDDIINLPKGTTIFVKAISNNTLDFQGIGEFWNPIYNQNIEGYEIWTDLAKFTATVTDEGNNDSGFLINELITANNGAQGILLGSINVGYFKLISGNWEGVTSITGNTSQAIADILNLTIPNYNINEKVKWGGYVWLNLTGNNGESLNIFELNEDWEKINYNSTDYNKTYDLIEYDINNDMITRRYEYNGNNNVKHTLEDSLSITLNNSISSFMFGNIFKDATNRGISNINVLHGYCENINFRGEQQKDLTFNKNAIQSNIIFDTTARQSNIIFGNNSSQKDINFLENCDQFNIVFKNNASQERITFGKNCIQSNIDFNNASYQLDIIFDNSNLQNSITFDHYSYQSNLRFLKDSKQESINFDKNCNILNLTIPINKTISYINLEQNVKIDFNSNTFTGDETIFQNYSKNIYKRPDGQNRIKYYNNSDVRVITEITN